MKGRLVLTVILAMSWTGEPGSAQSRLEVSVSPFVGSSDARGGIPNARILENGIHAVTYDDVSPMLVLGGSLRLDDGRSPFDARLSFTRSVGGEETGRWGCLPAVDGGPAGCPSILILVPTDITITTGAASVGAGTTLGIFELGAEVGAAWVRHAYEWDPSATGSFSLETGAASRNTGSAQLGVSLGAPVLGGRAVVRLEEFRSLGSTRDAVPDAWHVIGAGFEIRLPS